MNRVEVRNLSYHYSNEKGINSIDLSLEKGEVLCLFGKNGSGKSTLVRVLSTLYKPKQGSYFIDGEDALRHRTSVRKRFFTVFDTNPHFDFAPGRKNIDFFINIYQANSSDKISELCELFQLDTGGFVGEYSYGMKRKLYLIEALLSDKNILFFDEPTLGIDSETRDVFFDLITKNKPENTSIIFCTNRIEEVKYADRVMLVEGGFLKQTQGIQSILSRLTPVKFTINEKEFTDYISESDDLPILVKSYLRYGIPSKIEILSNDEDELWTKEALKKVNRAPKFVRPMVQSIVEKYALEKGHRIITPNIVDEARRRFEKK